MHDRVEPFRAVTVGLEQASDSPEEPRDRVRKDARLPLDESEPRCDALAEGRSRTYPSTKSARLARELESPAA